MKNVLLIVLMQTFVSAHAANYQLAPVRVYSDFEESEELAVSSSLTIVGEDEINKSNATHFADIVDTIPGLNYAGGSSRPRFFQIRGIGERSQFKGLSNFSVGVLIDDIEMSGMGDMGQLHDVEQVEVLKGSHTTRFGSSALAGHINYKTKDPTKNFEGDVSVTYGNYNTKKAQVAVGGPLTQSKKAQVRLSSAIEQSDGYIKNAHTGSDDTNKIDEKGTRLKLRFLPTAKLTIDATGLYSKQDNGYDTWTLDNTRTTQTDNPGVDKQELTGGSVKLSYKNNSINYQSITSGNSSTSNYNFDEDWNHAPVGDYNQNEEYKREKQRFSQELRAIGSGWSVGAYYQSFNEDFLFKDFKNGAERPSKGITSKYKNRSLSIFGEKELVLTDKTTLAIGLRGESAKSDYANNSDISSKPNEDMIGGNITLNYFVTDDSFVYSKLSRGFKAGGVNTEAALDSSRRNFDAEYMHTLEFGYKGTVSKNIQLSSSAFYSLRRNQQVKASYQAAPPAGDFTEYVANAGRTSNVGVESSAKWTPFKYTSVSAGASVLRAKFQDYSFEGTDYDGRDVAHAPTYQFSLGVTQHLTDAIYVSSTVTGKDKFYFSDSHDQQSHTYQLVNLNLGYKKDNFELALWGKNIFNKDYAVRGFYFDNESPWVDKLYTQKGAPRTFGVTVRASI